MPARWKLKNILPFSIGAIADGQFLKRIGAVVVGANGTTVTRLYGSATGTDYSTTSTTYVDVDGTNLKATLTTTSTSAIVVFIKYDASPTNSNNGDVAFLVDGAANTVLQHVNNAQSGPNGLFVRNLVVTGLSAASHTFSLGWRAVDGVALAIRNGSNTDTNGIVADSANNSVRTETPTIIIMVIG